MGEGRAAGLFGLVFEDSGAAGEGVLRSVDWREIEIESEGGAIGLVSSKQIRSSARFEGNLLSIPE